MERIEIWRCDRFGEDAADEPLYSIETDRCILVRVYVDNELDRQIHV